MYALDTAENEVSYGRIRGMRDFRVFDVKLVKESAFEREGTFFYAWRANVGLIVEVHMCKLVYNERGGGKVIDVHLARVLVPLYPIPRYSRAC